MSIQEYINQMKKEGIAQAFVVYCNLSNNSDELIVCNASDADNAGAVIVDVCYIEHSAFYRTAIITTEVI